MAQLLLWLMLGLIAAAAPKAQAQSCCGVASEDELSVAGWKRRAVLTSRIAVTHMLGRHDSRGMFNALPGGTVATDAQLALGAGLRMAFYEPLQLHGSIPVRVQYREVADAAGEATTASAFGAGDASLFVRWSALRDDELGLFDDGSNALPSLDLYVGGRAPTARYDGGPTARDQARTMGTGTFALILGARALKHLTPSHALRISARYELHGSRDVDDDAAVYERFRPGDIVSLSVGYLGLSGMHWAFGGTLDVTFTTDSSVRATDEGFREVPGSARREVTVGAHVTRALALPDVDLTLGLTYAPPIDRLSENTALEGIAGSLTLRWHWLR